MDVKALLGGAILFQLAAAIIALKLIPVTQSRKAWLAISLALFLMAVRRCISFHQISTESISPPQDLSAEWVTLLTSLLLLLGIKWIGPVFLSIKNASEALSRSEEKYRSLFEESRDVILVTDRGGSLLDVNPSGLKLFGYAREEFIGMDVRAIYANPEERSIFQQKIESEGSIVDHEVLLLKKDGAVMNCLLTGAVQKDADGAVMGYRCSIRDITEKKRMEEERRRFIEGSTEGIFQATPDSRFLMVNPALSRILGYNDPQELLESVESIRSQLFIETERVIELRRLLDEQGEVSGFEAMMRRKDGSAGWVSINARVIHGADGAFQHYEGVCKDISEQKQIENERALLATAIEQVAEGIVITDASGTIIFSNQGHQHLTGYASEELVGRNACAHETDDCLPLLQEGIQTCLKGGEVWSGQFSHKKKEGARYELRASISPVRNKLSEICNCVIVERDVTHESQLEKQLIQTQKLEAIGTLAGGIAHDFNNILSSVMGFTELAMLQSQAGSKVRKYLETSVKSCYRAKDLVNQILTFSRQGEQERKPVQLNYVVKEALNMLRASLPSTIEMRQTIVAKSLIMADPTQIHQVLLNLCTNAAHAMREKGGLLEVSLRDVNLDAENASLYPEAGPGPYVQLTVTDTGHGMEPEVMERIFDPYFTTKSPGEGTGLGLSVIHGIVKSHEGIIDVHSEPGKGSSFHVLLPVSAKASFGGTHQSEEWGLLAGGSERILFVDDEKDLCCSGRAVLEYLGYEVVAISSSVEALEAFRMEPDRFDLLITDMTMPKMTGIDLVKEVLKIRRDMPVILCSGFRRMITQEAAESIGIRHVLAKPVVAHELAASIRKALGEKPLKSAGKPSAGSLTPQKEKDPACGLFCNERSINV